MCGHICIENINKLYKYSGKCYYRHQYKAVLESDMLSTPEGLIDTSPMAVV